MQQKNKAEKESNNAIESRKAASKPAAGADAATSENPLYRRGSDVKEKQR